MRAAASDRFSSRGSPGDIMISKHLPHSWPFHDRCFHCLLNCWFRRSSKKHQSSASLAFVRRIHRGPANSPHKRPLTRNRVSIWWRHHTLSLEGLNYYWILYSIHSILCKNIPHEVARGFCSWKFANKRWWVWSFAKQMHFLDHHYLTRFNSNSFISGYENCHFGNYWS